MLGRNQAKLRSVAAILVKVRDGESMAQASEDVEGLLRQRHRLLPLQDNDFTIRDLSAVTSAKEAVPEHCPSFLHRSHLFRF